MVKRKRVSMSWSRGRACPRRGHMEENASVTVSLKTPQRPVTQKNTPVPWARQHSPSTRRIWPLARQSSPSTKHIRPLARKSSPSIGTPAAFSRKTRPACHEPRFLGHFPSLGEFFAFAFMSDRTWRTFSRPEHRDAITMKPTASLNARPGTKLSQQPASHTLGGTKLSQLAKKRLFLPKMHQQGELCTARRVQKPSRENFVSSIASSPH